VDKLVQQELAVVQNMVVVQEVQKTLLVV
jgi:hypothetical protein